MAHHVLIYDFADDYLERRTPFREAHLRLAWEAADRGDLLLGGPMAEPIDGALIIFRGEGPEPAEAFARADPYVAEGIVTRWHVRRWTTVVGPLADTPVRQA